MKNPPSRSSNMERRDQRKAERKRLYLCPVLTPQWHPFLYLWLKYMNCQKSNFRPLGSNLSLIEIWPHWEDTNSHHHCNFIAPIWSFPLSSDIVKPFIAKPGARSSTNCISSPRDEIGLSLKLLDTADCYLYPTHTYHVCSMHKSLVGTSEDPAAYPYLHSPKLHVVWWGGVRLYHPGA